MRKLAAIVTAIVAIAVGGTLAASAKPGLSKQDAGQAMYKQKPGCGPDKTDGVAGSSGRHTGQPPKLTNRLDCPNPPGQQK
jgi:hypothetical protein